MAMLRDETVAEKTVVRERMRLFGARQKVGTSVFVCSILHGWRQITIQLVIDNVIFVQSLLAVNGHFERGRLISSDELVVDSSATCSSRSMDPGLIPMDVHVTSHHTAFSTTQKRTTSTSRLLIQAQYFSSRHRKRLDSP